MKKFGSSSLQSIEMSSETPAIATASNLGHLALLFAAIAVATLFFVEGNRGLNLADEGFLWYGAQRSTQGEIPIRDFRSYDPGRYLLAGGWMRITGDDGLLALRQILALVQAAGLILALRLFDKPADYRDFLSLLGAICLLLMWMYPRHKLMDITVSIAIVFSLIRFVNCPSPGQAIIAGIVIGGAAFFGRNHGLYGLVAALGTVMLAYLVHAPSQPVKLISRFLIGVLIGYLPMLILLAVSPQFAIRFWEGLVHLFDRGTTNLSIDMPLPWEHLIPGSGVEELRVGVTGLFLFLIPVFALVIMVQTVRWPRETLMKNLDVVTAAIVSVPYAHAAFSRPDISHVAQTIFPTLIAILLTLQRTRGFRRIWLGLLLLALGFFVSMNMHPVGVCRASSPCYFRQVAASQVLVDANTRAELDVIETLVTKFARGRKSFLVAPNLAGAYAIYGVKAPMWDTYPLFPMSNPIQIREIERIEHESPVFVLLKRPDNTQLTGPDFRQVRPLVYDYIMANYSSVAVDGFEDSWEVFVSQ